MKFRAALVVLVATAIPHLASGADAAHTDGQRFYAAGTLEDPRLRESSVEQQRLRRWGDAAFERPFYIARLLAGVALLPVALPIAWIFTDSDHALDICVTGPYEMAFERPLGD